MKNSLFRAAFAVAAFCLSGAMASASEMHMTGDEIQLGNLTLTSYWTRAMPPTAAAGGGFVTITNNADSDDRLVSATSDVGGVVEIHEMSIENDVMKMQSLPDGLVIPAGETVELKPGGYHIMFIGVEDPFQAGEEVHVDLHFEKAGEITVILPVAPMGSTSMPMDHSSH